MCWIVLPWSFIWPVYLFCLQQTASYSFIKLVLVVVVEVDSEKSTMKKTRLKTCFFVEILEDVYIFWWYHPQQNLRLWGEPSQLLNSVVLPQNVAFLFRKARSIRRMFGNATFPSWSELPKRFWEPRGWWVFVDGWSKGCTDFFGVEKWVRDVCRPFCSSRRLCILKES